MNFNNFEHPQNSLTTKQRMEIVTSPEEVLEQLQISEGVYQEAIGKLRTGNKEDLDYLVEMQANLVAFKKKFVTKFESLTPDTEETSRLVNYRLRELSEELEKLNKEGK